MENVIEKLGFFDFFNLIIVGVFTIIGCFGITYQFGWGISNEVVRYLVNTAEVNTILLALFMFSIITVSYIIGMLCHEVFSLIERDRIFIILITNLFEEKSCIENKKKRIRYADLARKIFDNNGIDYTWKEDDYLGIDWGWELNNYFFAYCLYQLQIRGVNRKTEKLRDIEGLAKSFCVSNILLLIVLLVGRLVSWDTFLLPRYLYGGEVVLLIIVSLIFSEYRKKALKNRIRMTLSLFEAVIDREEKYPKSA